MAMFIQAVVTALLMVQGGRLVAGEGTILVHMHVFRIVEGCPDHSINPPEGHTNSCEVFFRVCLQPQTRGRPGDGDTLTGSAASNQSCELSSYTTERFKHVGKRHDVSLSTAQLARLAFKGRATMHSVMVEFWGHEEVAGSQFKRLGTFHTNITKSLGEWSENTLLRHHHPATLSIQWQVQCSFGYWPVGECSTQCISTNCGTCLPNGDMQCLPGCADAACKQTRNGSVAMTTTLAPTSQPGGGCHVNSCQNGGTCILQQLEDGSLATLSYCQCPTPYTGQHCQQVTVPTYDGKSLETDDNLAVTIIIFTAIGIAAIILVGFVCFCYRRIRQDFGSFQHKRSRPRLSKMRWAIPVDHSHKDVQASDNGCKVEHSLTEISSAPSDNNHRSSNSSQPASDTRNRFTLASEEIESETRPSPPPDNFLSHTYEEIPASRQGDYTEMSLASAPVNSQHRSNYEASKLFGQNHTHDEQALNSINGSHAALREIPFHGYEMPVDMTESKRKPSRFSGLRHSRFSALWWWHPQSRRSSGSRGRSSAESVTWEASSQLPTAYETVEESHFSS